MKALSSLAGFLVAVSTALSGPADVDSYSNPTLGLTITKPRDWHFITEEQHSENTRRAKLKDQTFQALVQKYSTTPLVAMMKHRESFPDLNPSLKVNVRPLGEFKAEDAKAVLQLIAAPLADVFHDLEVIEAPKDTTVAGHKGAYMRVHYQLVTADGQQFPTCSEMWVVPRENYFLLLGAGTRQDEKSGRRAEIHAIVSSLILE